MLELPENVALLTHWQHAARLCMAARERPSVRTIEELTDHLELAFMLSWRLDCVGHPETAAAPSVKGAHHRAAQPHGRRVGRVPRKQQSAFRPGCVDSYDTTRTCCGEGCLGLD